MEKSPNPDSNERKELIERFEQMLKTNEVEFLEVSTFEYLIDYYSGANELAKALNVAKIGLKQYPYSTELITSYAGLLHDTDRDDEALEQIEKAVLLSPQDSELLAIKGDVLLNLEKFDEAIECYENLIFLVSEKSDIYYQIGMCYFGKENPQKAIEYFRLALEEDSLNEDAFYELINVLEGMDMLEETLPLYKEYIDKDPFDFKAWHNLGVVYERMLMQDQAIEAYEYALAIQDDFAPSLFNLACVHLAEENLAKAIDCFNQVKGLDSWKDVLVFINLGHCYTELGQYDVALKEYHRALKHEPDNYLAYFGIGRCLDRQEKWLEAVHFLNKAAKIYEYDVNVWLLLAKTEYQLGNIISAVSSLIKASETEPEIPEIWLDWSYIVSEQGDFDKALEILNLGIDELPEEASLYYRAVVYLIKASKYKEAFLYLENALTLDFEKHTELFEFFPELDTQKALMKIIDQFSEK